MTTFKHKSLPIEIGYSEYCKLSSYEQANFSIVNISSSIKNTTHNTTVTNNQNTSDVLGIGEAVGTVVAVPLVVLGGIFGLFD